MIQPVSTWKKIKQHKKTTDEMNPLCLRLEAKKKEVVFFGNVPNNHSILIDHVRIDQKSVRFSPNYTSPF